MFEAKLNKAQTLQKIVDAIKDLVQDAPFDCSEGSISLQENLLRTVSCEKYAQAMDSSHVALVSLKLESHGFDTYRCDRQQNLGISLNTLAKILKCAGSDDTVTLRYSESSDVVTIMFDDQKRDKQQECELKLMDIDMESLGIPEQDYAVKVTMPSGEFSKAIRDLSNFTDSLNIVATKAGLQFQGKGDNGQNTIRWGQQGSADGDNDVSIELTEPVTITFAIKYLLNFIKATSLSERVSLSMSPDVPIVIEYPIEDMGYLRYYLAPKIDDEEMPDN